MEGTGPVAHLVQHALLQRGARWRRPRWWRFSRCGSRMRARCASPAPTWASTGCTPASPRWCCCCSATSSRLPPSTPGRWCASPARAASPPRPQAGTIAVFQKPLSFYLFDLPFYGLLRSYVLALVIFCILLYWVAARAWQLRYRFPDLREPREIRPQLLPAGGRPGIALPARRRGVPAAGAGGALLPGPLRNGLQRARLVPGGHGLRGPEHRPAAAMAADCRLPGRRRVGAGCGRWMLAGQHGRWRWWSRSWRRGWFPRCTCGPTKFRWSGRTSRRTSTPPAAPTGWSSRCSEVDFKAQPDAPIDVDQHKAAARQRAPVGMAAPSTTPSRRSRRCAPITSSTTATWTATPSTANTARCCWRRASWISASFPTPAPTGSTRPSFTRTAMAWCWPKSAR